ncbi:MAG: hypothetical protein DYG89_50810 [Caldilinea sp. CFX5]|nr:hypothetical protein [Caldilinea sp. CFX5]
MPILRIHLLGDFQLTYGGQAVTAMNTARLQALLAYLLLHRHAPQTRQHLAFLFWPDTSEAQALTNLRNLLHKLRQALPEPDHFLLADAQTVQWRPDAPFTLDVADFEAALTQATTCAELETAVKHYSGPLLPSCYDDWILPEREAYQRRASEALTRLLDALERMNDHRTAIGYGQQLLQLDPTDEGIYGRLMHSYAALGDRSGLLRVYQNCVTALERELDVEPMAATHELYEQLLHSLRQPASPPPAPAPVTTNLPIPVSSFVGRQREIAEIKACLQGTETPDIGQHKVVRDRRLPPVRLVTLIGAGGSGKTRLALQVATALVDAYADGVWWIDLVALQEASLVPQVVAHTLGVSEAHQTPLPTTLLQFLQKKELLLVLDNCEHLIDACAQLAYTLLSRCARVQILATSREPLGITGEHVYPAPILSLPGSCVGLSPERLLDYEAIRLFVERAQSIDPDFRLTTANAATICQVCQRLDGIPLALELAAARMKVLTVEQIAGRLNDRLRLLTAGSRTAAPHHQTLRATLDWSYDLLTAEEQLLFRRLAIFAGSFPLAAVEEICGPLPAPTLDLLTHLVEKSLVTVERTGQGVYYRLFETMRDYAREKLLSSGEIEHLRLRHLHFFIRATESLYDQWDSVDREYWMACLERLHNNIRIALRRAMESGKAVEALRLAAATGSFWELRGYWGEGRQWLAQALALSDRTGTYLNQAADLRSWTALALARAGAMTWRQCDFTGARILLEKSLALDRKVDKWDGISATLGILGGVAFEQGDYAAAQAYYTESLAAAHVMGTKHPVAMAHFCLGLVAYHLADYSAAHEHLAESLTRFREIGHSDVAYSLNALGNLANLQGNEAAAWPFYQECLTLRRTIGDKRGVAATLNDIANLTAKQGDYGAAYTHYQESLRLFQELGNQRGVVGAFSGLARLQQVQGNLHLAVKLLGAVETHLSALTARLDEPEHSDKAQAIATLRAHLEPATFDATWSAGCRLSLEQAITLTQAGG